jgi:hypothetical protein
MAKVTANSLHPLIWFSLCFYCLTEFFIVFRFFYLALGLNFIVILLALFNLFQDIFHTGKNIFPQSMNFSTEKYLMWISFFIDSGKKCLWDGWFWVLHFCFCPLGEENQWKTKLSALIKLLNYHVKQVQAPDSLPFFIALLKY